MNEQVLVFPEEIFIRIGIFNGFFKDVNKFLNNQEWRNSLRFVDRSWAETTERIKQVISYDVITQEGKIFVYQRTPKGGENRLHGRYSIGVGGHTNCEIELCMKRELKEEVGLNVGDYEAIPLGCIYSNADAVSRVHFGICHEVRVHKDFKLECTEDALANGRFMDRADIVPIEDKFEEWSKILLREII